MKPVVVAIIFAALAGVARGQTSLSLGRVVDSASVQPAFSARVPWSAPEKPVPLFDNLPRFPMAPENALKAFERGNERQAIELQGYSALTLIKVKLPDLSQWGEFELWRIYVAPNTLQFIPMQFTGDNFVKTNVIARLLQSEAARLRNAQQFGTAINGANYRISYKGTTEIDGRVVHVYQLKPRRRRVGLFEGRMFLDAFNGSLVRNEGQFVRTPSIALKKVEFVQDYMDIGDFTFPKHTHSAATTRLIGRAIVDIDQYDYRFPAATAVGSGETVAESGILVSQGR